MPTVPLLKRTSFAAPIKPPDDQWVLMAAAQMHSEGRLVEPQENWFFAKPKAPMVAKPEKYEAPPQTSNERIANAHADTRVAEDIAVDRMIEKRRK